MFKVNDKVKIKDVFKYLTELNGSIGFITAITGENSYLVQTIKGTAYFPDGIYPLNESSLELSENGLERAIEAIKCHK